MLKHLAAKHHVTLACLIDEASDLSHIPFLRQYAPTVFHDQISPGRKRLTSLLAALCSSMPISIPYFYSRDLQSRIDSFLDRTPVDTVFCSSSPTAQYIFQSRHYQGSLNIARRIMDYIDMDSEKWRQYAEQKRFPLSWIYQREACHLLRFEKRIAEEFDQLLIVSEPEKKLFQRIIATDKIHAASNGVDLDFFSPQYRSPRKLQGTPLVFTGAMDYWPNIEGAIWFAEKVLPRIRRQIPDACLFLVGSHPGRELTALANRPGIIVTGFVDDVRAYIAEAEVCVIPLHVARGLQNKVLEAMAMGKPVVCTPQAAEGLKIAPESISMQKDEISFSNAVVSLIQDKKAAGDLAGKARTAMEKNYSWQENLSILDTLISTGTPPTPNA